MAICEQMGISHSHYLGGPPTWTADDRAKAEAYAAYKHGSCPQCGTRPEWWDPKQGGHRHAFIAEPVRCEGCSRKEELQRQLPNDSKGLHVHLIPNPELMATEEASDG